VEGFNDLLVVGSRDETVIFMYSDAVIVTILKGWLHCGTIAMGPAGDFILGMAGLPAIGQKLGALH
jgi:hypothetical protein